jgi:hypothetical protein
LVGNFEQISYAIFIVVFFLGLTVAGLFILRNRQADESVVLTLGYPVTPLVFLLLVATMLLVAARNPRETVLGVVVVLAGLPVYEILGRRLPAIAAAETGN